MFPRSPRNGGGKTLKPQTKTNPADDFKGILKQIQPNGEPQGS